MSKIELDPKVLNVLSTLTRIEVIDKQGRQYVRYLKLEEIMSISLQDDNRTIKIFID